MRFAVLVRMDPHDLHRLQTSSSWSRVIGEVGDTGCGG
jgi:hypothetical protein